jgi:hypothetical protein
MSRKVDEMNTRMARSRGWTDSVVVFPGVTAMVYLAVVFVADVFFPHEQEARGVPDLTRPRASRLGHNVVASVS